MTSLKKLLGFGRTEKVGGVICCNISPETNYHNRVSLDYAITLREKGEVTSEEFRAIELNARNKGGCNPDGK